MLLVYTHQISPRIVFTFKHLCENILQIPVKFTSKIEDFIAHDELKMSYTKQPLSTELFIKSSELLFEIGISDQEIQVQKWEDTVGFFPTDSKSALPFDIFAASFYLLSRYEEYLPHMKDHFNRFSIKDSLAFKSGFHKQAVVNIWALKLQAILEGKFENWEFKTESYKIQPIIEVPESYAYKYKSFFRKIGGFISDGSHLRFSNIYQRFSVLLGVKKDPLDTYKWLINKQKQLDVKFIVFFLIGKFSTYNKNISLNHKKFVSLIKYIADYSYVGLLASFFASDKEQMLKEEKLKLEQTINRPLTNCKFSHEKIYFPTSYRQLLKLEILKDCSLFYPNHLALRASTCTPFYFYDLEYETITPLLIYPVLGKAQYFKKHKSQLDKTQDLARIINEFKKVNGMLCLFFNNAMFSDTYFNGDFKTLFIQYLNSIKTK